MGMAFVCMSSAWSQEQARVILSTPTWVPSNTVNSQGEILMYTAFNVVYEHAGKQYTVQMPYDPGSFVTLQISPTYSASTPAVGLASKSLAALVAKAAKVLRLNR